MARMEHFANHGAPRVGGADGTFLIIGIEIDGAPPRARGRRLPQLEHLDD